MFGHFFDNEVLSKSLTLFFILHLEYGFLFGVRNFSLISFLG